MRVPIRSRLGNALLGFLGIIYVLSASITLIYYVASTWGAMGLTDYALQLALIASVVGGGFFIAIAKQNLKPSRGAEKSRSAPGHQTAPATGS